jgi:antitoxin HicB
MTITIHLDPSVLQYRVEIRPEAEADGRIVYIAEIPDLPGCMSHGSTIDEARQSLEDAKREYLLALDERNLPIPAPSPEAAVGSVTWTVVDATTGVESVGTVTGAGLKLRQRTEALDPA